MKFTVLRLVQTFAVVLLFTAINGPAFALDANEVPNSAQVNKHRKKSAKHAARTDPYLYGSSETQKMRDKRLSRECKGAANGGACRGYTQ